MSLFTSVPPPSSRPSDACIRLRPQPPSIVPSPAACLCRLPCRRPPWTTCSTARGSRSTRSTSGAGAGTPRCGPPPRRPCSWAATRCSRTARRTRWARGAALAPGAAAVAALCMSLPALAASARLRHHPSRASGRPCGAGGPHSPARRPAAGRYRRGWLPGAGCRRRSAAAASGPGGRAPHLWPRSGPGAAAGRRPPPGGLPQVGSAAHGLAAGPATRWVGGAGGTHAHSG
jgi:hypothetical protein